MKSLNVFDILALLYIVLALVSFFIGYETIELVILSALMIILSEIRKLK